MKNTGCREEDLLSHYYGDLDPPARARLETHLGGCAACREKLVEIGRLLDRIPKTEPEIPAVDVRRFAARVAERASARRDRLPVWGGALAATTVLAAVLLFRWPHSAPEFPALKLASELDVVRDLELLQELELLEDLEWLQEMEETG